MLFKECAIAKLGEPILREKAKEVDNINAPEIQKLIKTMIRCVKKSQGVGIAAPQIFAPYQIVIINSHPNDRYPDAPLLPNEVLINPKLVRESNEKIKDWEGCLSIPGLRGKVTRSKSVEVEYTNVKGEKKYVTFEDFIARIFLHEFDHLNGKVFTDRVEDNSDLISEEVYFKHIVPN